MERLTEKNRNTYDLVGECLTNVEEFSKNIDTILDKLGQYEDNDEKLGIDYNTITQALLKGVYYIEYGEKKIRHTNGLCLCAYDGKTFWLANKWHNFHMEDYGKSKFNAWALTREELESQEMIKKGFLTDKPIY